MTIPDSQSPVMKGANSFAGAGLGLLVGVLAGLATVPVVSALLGTLATVAVAYISIRSTPTKSANLIRAGAFGFACAVAVCVGVHIRATNLLGLTPARYVAQLKAAGVPEADAVKLLVRNREAEVPNEHVSAVSSSGLFATSQQEKDAILDMLSANGEWSAIRENIKKAYPGWSRLAYALDKSELTDKQKRELFEVAVSIP